ncbi:LysE family translocator [Parasphingorhabdus cellanae]|uniref:LysE family translocator n=1 Tax=Parasphingorhabdus cellanae TaxID=2806553 RepID=A0ABX7T398_9SPHN|nr:LysE family translocator [Parasphingorhabdus cellanae]QTD55022.1 LysE family translocator [Parasphingorhabdus cellanae]
MDFNTFLLFAGTTLVVVASPGPAAIAVTSQGSGNGVLRAQSGILGIASANALYFALSALGIASVIIASSLLFTAIKWAGVAYLVYLGLSAIMSKSGGLNIVEGRQESFKAMFTKGFLVEFANPKALLYFAAILPQFLDPASAILPQILIMGVTTALLDIIVYSGYAYLGHGLAKSRLNSGVIKILNRIAGSALLFTAFKVARLSS